MTNPTTHRLAKLKPEFLSLSAEEQVTLLREERRIRPVYIQPKKEKKK